MVLGKKPDQVFDFDSVRFRSELGTGYLVQRVQRFGSHSPDKILLVPLQPVSVIASPFIIGAVVRFLFYLPV